MNITQRKSKFEQIEYIESRGFKVKGTRIYKLKTNKCIGSVNENNFWFYSTNPAPFNQGVNYYDSTTLVNPEFKVYVRDVKKTEEADAFDSHIGQYEHATQHWSKFQEWLDKTILYWTINILKTIMT